MTQAQLHTALEQSGLFWNPFAEYEEIQPVTKPRRENRRPAQELTPYQKHRRPAYQAGKQACIEGWSKSANPFSPASLNSSLWLDGYAAAKGAKR
jgi:ribosome modulation factor